ncbi:MAG: polysaccharide deacetylase family protein [Bacteroidales bacterium]|jgi:peptidoglycan/xylan/chitin deacetylase (PgdA/CDA1 family)|nr:polysaccharide deacetylase family protein [Bacteroidales bacterium]MCU0407964.1 polysaccharide deacetylase family protein [Bacteroidales bacterium]
MRLFRPLFPSGLVYREARFRLEDEGNSLCLTFDDGPCEGSTVEILDILESYGISAVFFCNGKSAERLPELINAIRSRGHVIGNHGYEHLDGWRTSCRRYLGNAISAEPFTSFSLFRPPFGRMSLCQYREIAARYTIVMWDLMPYDFDKGFGKERCLEVLFRKTRPGSVIALHDTGGSHAADILGEYINFALGSGYRFENPFNK